MSVTVRSFAKINLGLRIGPPRADSFHDLVTLYQTIGLHDELTVQAERSAATEIALTCSDVRVPTDARNTVHRIVAAALEMAGVTARIAVHLQKNLPMQGGLGAGSANAVAALLAVERELGLELPGTERLRLAAKIGSDVPLFLLGGTVYGHGRGEQVLPYPDLPPMHCVVVLPGVGSSTPAAFKAWDERVAALTLEAASGRLDELSRVYASAFTPTGKGDGTGTSGASGALDVGPAGTPVVIHGESGSLAGNALPALVRTGIENDFEELVFLQHPSLRDSLHALWGEDGVPSEQRALYAALSGSGSSLFGLYGSAEAAATAAARAQALGGRALQTRTLPRPEYWRTTFA